MSEQFTFFLSGPFSQWYGTTPDDSRFKLYGIEYSCAEQFMMCEKARLFDDEETFDKVLAAKHPRDQKKLGRQVKGFDQNVWEIHARDIVYRGNHAKFTQNPRLMTELLATEGTALVECNPKDPIWGIGLSTTDPLRLDRSTWKGTNWLGQVLTRLRNDLIEKKHPEHFDEFVKKVETL